MSPEAPIQPGGIAMKVEDSAAKLRPSPRETQQSSADDPR